ncbi:hypothetical protein ACJX0J_040302, partial [Zea mays]
GSGNNASLIHALRQNGWQSILITGKKHEHQGHRGMEGVFSLSFVVGAMGASYHLCGEHLCMHLHYNAASLSTQMSTHLPTSLLVQEQDFLQHFYHLERFNFKYIPDHTNLIIILVFLTFGIVVHIGFNTTSGFQLFTIHAVWHIHLSAALIVGSEGVPMFYMGDEYGHTKGENNNTYCHDHYVNYFRWDRKEEQSFDLYRFCCLMTKFR